MAAGPLALAAAASPQQFPFIDFKTRLLLPSCHCGSSRVGRRQASCPRAMPRLAGAGDSRWGGDGRGCFTPQPGWGVGLLLFPARSALAVFYR